MKEIARAVALSTRTIASSLETASTTLTEGAGEAWVRLNVNRLFSGCSSTTKGGGSEVSLAGAAGADGGGPGAAPAAGAAGAFDTAGAAAAVDSNAGATWGVGTAGVTASIVSRVAAGLTSPGCSSLVVGTTGVSLVGSWGVVTAGVTASVVSRVAAGVPSLGGSI